MVENRMGHKCQCGHESSFVYLMFSEVDLGVANAM